VHPDDLLQFGLEDGQMVVLGNKRGQVRLHAKAFDGVQQGVMIAESIWPNTAYEDGCGINSLTGADQPAPAGGGLFHDISVWIRAAS
jgi:anaerobic selenocysteine-containing dehydrogenase